MADSADSSVWVLLGTGDANVLGQATEFPVGGAAYGVAAADLDADGSMDVAVVGGTESLWVLMGNGDGTLGSATESITGNVPRALVMAEYGDGGADVLVANTQASLASSAESVGARRKPSSQSAIASAKSPSSALRTPAR